MNKLTQSEVRTTTLSISSMANALFNAIFVFIFGIFADWWGIHGMFHYVLLLFLVLTVILLFYIRRFYK
jgi:membrane protein implicated in regulation of membrane protease activity